MQVISQVKAFSTFKALEAFELLDTPLKFAEEEDAAFQEAACAADVPLAYELARSTSFKTQGDLFDHMGVDLALRCMESNPADAGKEATRRELISPVIFAAAALSGQCWRTQYVGCACNWLIPLPPCLRAGATTLEGARISTALQTVQ